MKSIWSGAISFGLVNIPVNLYNAIELRGGLEFDMLDKESMSKIKYKRVAEESGKEVDYADIVKGYEYEKGEYVVLSNKDFEEASPEKSKTIDISGFINIDEIDTVYFHKPYYLEPSKNAEKAYLLLLEALKKSKKVGIAQFILKNTEHLTIIKPMNNILVLEMLRFQEDIRDPEKLNLPTNIKIPANEINMAIKLIEQLSEKFKPGEYKDTYTEQLKQLIDSKLKGKSVHKKTKKTEPTHVKDLMDVLRKSLEAGKKKNSKAKKHELAEV